MEYTKLLEELSPTRLAQLFDVQGLSQWHENDIAAILSHQLNAPLIPDLLGLPDGERLRPLLAAMPAAQSATFLAALTSPATDVRVLEAIKSFAQEIRDTTEHPSHGECAMVLYYAAIAAALVHAQVRITTLKNEELKVGLQWAIVRATPSDIRALFKAALSGQRD